jgi:hypothetical protein
VRVPEGTRWAWYMLALILLAAAALILLSLDWNAPTA